ncbi:MAG TPA: xanthine dehydrogenase family protein molybdopterin-binding subunit [Terriglobales bacterium]|nr:xanthine dehydrogenase family protein molybdopterin-binding subunit [Terriglobales bacterium]
MRERIFLSKLTHNWDVASQIRVKAMMIKQTNTLERQNIGTNFIGKPYPRIGAQEIVTGRAVYVYDMEMPRMLHGAVKRSTMPHAEIVSIDKTRAEAFPGVHAVITGADVPNGLRGRGLYDTPILAKERIRYIGEPIAAVAAESREAAIEAARLIEVQYRELKPIFDPLEAVKENPDVVVHPDLPRYKRFSSQIYRAAVDPKRPNVTNKFCVRHGSTEDTFKKADFVFENTFRTHPVQHMHIESVAAIASAEPDGTLVVWTSGQNVYRARKELSDGLGIRPSRIKLIIPRYVGGGFGNKGQTHAELICAVLSLKTRRPVKITFSREEVFESTSIRHPCVIRIKDGVRADGRIVAREMETVYNGGAYSLAGNVAVRDCVYASVCVYDIANFKLDVYRVYTNQVQGGAFRGFGTPQAFFAIESQMDLIARRLSIDPIELRLKNMLTTNAKNAMGETMRKVSLQDCITKAIEQTKLVQTPKLNEPWKFGRGFAVAQEMCDISFPSMAYAKYFDDNTVEISTVVSDPGEGTTTVLAQIAAEEFQLPMENVTITQADSSIAPVGPGASGSRQTSQLGKAVSIACRDVKSQILTIASHSLNSSVDSLEINNGVVRSREDLDVKIGVSELFKPGPMGGGFVEGIGEFSAKAVWYPETGELDPETGQCSTDRAVAYYTPVVQVVDLAVNVETGEIKLLNIIGVLDVGKVINPLNVSGQNEGGIIMGASTTIPEELVIRDGRVINADLKDYKIWTSMDYVPIQSVILENPFEEGPFGAKGCGEAPIIATAPAIANAIHNAIGIRFKTLPVTSERILKALKQKRNNETIVVE